MTKQELEKYKKLLLDKKEEVHKAIKQLEEDSFSASKDSKGDVADVVDTASESYNTELSLGIASNSQKILYEIDEALKRIKDKSYGNCNTCGKPIPKMRLKALPYAEFCIQCQSEQEQNERFHRPPTDVPDF